MTLVKVSQREVKLGAPLEFSVYSAAGKLLLSKGYVLQSTSQIDRLFDVGAFRDQSTPSRQTSEAGSRLPVFTPTRRPSEAPIATNTDFPAMIVKPEAFHLTIVGGDGVPIASNLVGVVSGQGLLITVDSHFEALLPGTEVEVKILFGRNIYRFSTRAVGRSAAPFEIVTLDYPQAVSKVTLRQHFRVKTALTGRLLRNDGMTSGFDASIVNLSLSGLRLSLSSVSLNVGEHFQLSIRLCINGRFQAVMLNCVARNRSQSEEATLIGAEFGALSDETRRLVKDFVFEAATGAAS